MGRVAVGECREWFSARDLGDYGCRYLDNNYAVVFALLLFYFNDYRVASLFLTTRFGLAVIFV